MSPRSQTLSRPAGAPAPAAVRSPRLTAADRRRLAGWNATAVPYPQDRLLHELFAAQAARTPAAPAVACEGRSLTYRELAERAERLARHLRGLGAGPDTVVAICAERSLDLVVGLLGILEAGAAYLPLDPGYPPDRLSFMLEDSAAPILLTQESLAVRLTPPAGTRVVLLDAEVVGVGAGLAPAREGTSPSPTCSSNREGDVRPLPDHLAYVIYTSGSTGKPKGAMNTHRAIVNRLLWMQEAYGLTAADCVLQKTPASFDVSVWEFFWPLLTGARLLLARPGGHQDAAYLVDLIAGEGVTTVHFVPSMLRGFLEQPGVESCASLVRVICSGEALPAELAERFHARLPAELHNLYGPTEAAVDVTAWQCERESRSATVPIGRPIANLRIHLVDRDLRPVPVGEPGELAIAGVGLARGYLARPGLTAERFVPSPFAAGERLYRTGDLARHREDGAVEYLGRLDQQVKIRGFRIELGEIEAALAVHPGVREAAVAAVDGPAGDRRLVAYLVPRSVDGSPGELVRGVRAALAERLPEFMVPAAFVLLDALPLSPAGKLDRLALAALAPADALQPDLAAAYRAPATPAEETLAAIWGEVLALPRVGAGDSFFDLGGHSLLATQVISRVRDRLAVELALADLFEHPTLGALARRVEEKGRDRRAAADPILPVPRRGDLPLSFSQERIWFLQQLDPAIRSYQFQAKIRFAGRLDVTALDAALSEVVRRHEIFRTTFLTGEGGRPAQRFHAVWPGGAVRMPLVDLSGLPAAAREAEAEARMGDEFARPFDVARLPLARWTILRLGALDHLWVHVEHHLVHDGWSFNVLLEEMAALYRAAVEGSPSPLPELAVQFADFAVWQRRWAASEAAAAQLAFWKRTLAGRPAALELPTDRPWPKRQSFRGRVARAELPEPLAQALRAAGRRLGLSLFMILEAAFAALMGRYSGQEQVNVGSAVANRRRRETETMIGMVVDNLVLANDLAGDPTAAEHLGRVRRLCLAAGAHQEVPFDLVVEALAPPRDLSRNPLFQVSFSFHDSPLGELVFPGAAARLTEALSNGSAKFALNVICIPRAEQRVGRQRSPAAVSRAAAAGGITVVWEYATDLFDAATIDRMLGHYRTLLAALAEEERLGRRLSELPLLTAPEREQLRDWNRTAAAFDLTPVHQQVAAGAAASPGALAVARGGEGWTYGELQARASGIARRLRALGVGREGVIAICLPRSPEMVMAMLAALEAGAAYLPLDPAHPAERRALTVTDAGATVVLTDEAHKADFAGCGTAVFTLDDLDGVAIPERSDAPEPALSDQLAYVIYTSGSTGRPKGVEVTHGGLANLVAWHRRTYGVTAADRATQLASPAFDASGWEIWPYLAAGASLHLPDDDVRASPRRLLAWLAAEGITLSFLPTPLAEAVLDEATDDPSHREGDLTLRALLTGGDRLRRVPPERLPFRLVNHYGPTEGTVVSTWAEVAGGEAERLPPIGRPIANVRVHLADRHLRQAPAGVPGELLVGGAGLARGYRGAPDLTAERFVPDPWSAERGARLYRTGDLARYLPDGAVEFLGRIDFQVKVRGFRVELQEIEAALLRHPAVREAVVVARPLEGTSAEASLVAYLVPAGEVDPADLAGFLKRLLPDYMLPAAFVTLPALPLTANGKVDRKGLPAPPAAGAAVDGGFLAPRTAVEELVGRLWSELTGAGRVGVWDDFFRLGGHSLLATRMLSRLRDAIDLELPLSALFEAPTLEGFAAAVEDALLAAEPFDAAASSPP